MPGGMSRDLTFNILADVQDLRNKLGDVERHTRDTADKTDAAAARIRDAWKFVAAAGLVHFVGELLETGTQAEAFEQRFGVVFEGVGGDLERWAEQSAEAFGVSEAEMKGLLASVGDLLVPVGIARDEAADMSIEVLNLAQALSLWTGGNISVEDATQRITKAMLGEREGLVELGVKLSDAELQARKAEMGLDGLTGAADQQADALVTLQIVTEKSGDALAALEGGQYETALATNAAKSEWANFQQQLSEFVVTVAPPILEFTADLIGSMTNLASGESSTVPELIRKVQEEFRLAAEAGGELSDEMQLLEDAYETAKGGVENVTESLEDQGYMIDSVTGLLVPLGQETDTTRQKSEEFTDAVDDETGAMEDAADASDDLTQSIKDQASAHLDALNPLKQLYDAEKDLEEAQATVNQLIQDGTTEGREWELAVTDLAIKQADWNIANAEVRGSLEEVTGALSDTLSEAGLAADEIYEFNSTLWGTYDASYGAGGAMRDGLLAGLAGLGSQLSAAVIWEIEQGMAQIAGEFIILSPSQRWAKEIGEPLGLGIAEGILNVKDVIAAAASEVVKAASGVAPPPGSPAGTTSGGAGGGASPAGPAAGASDQEMAQLQAAWAGLVDEFDAGEHVTDKLHYAFHELVEKVDEGEIPAEDLTAAIEQMTVELASGEAGTWDTVQALEGYGEAQAGAAEASGGAAEAATDAAEAADTAADAQGSLTDSIDGLKTHSSAAAEEVHTVNARLARSVVLLADFAALLQAVNQELNAATGTQDYSSGTDSGAKLAPLDPDDPVTQKLIQQALVTLQQENGTTGIV